MKNTFLPLLGFAFLFILASCEKGKDDMAEIQPAPQVTNSISEKIVFHYSRLDLTDNTRTGFIVDKNGKLKTYSLSSLQSSQLPETIEWNESDIDFLYMAAGQPVLSIEQEEMDLYYSKIAESLAGKLVPEVGASSTDALITYGAFTSITTTVEAGTCELCNADSYDETIYKARLLKIAGSDNRMNDSGAAADLVEWMETLVLEAGL